MTEGNILKSIILYSIPLILGNFMQQLYNTFDSLIVGNYVGSSALAAVGAGGQISFFLVAFYLGASSGAGILISQYYGAKDDEKLHAVVHNMMGIGIVLGIVITIVGIIFCPTFLGWIGTPADMMPDAVTYLRIFFGGMLFQVVYNMLAAVLNAVGNSKRSLIYLIISSGFNIILDLLFVCVFKLGIAGAAWATIISQAVCCVLILKYLMGVEANYKVKLKDITLQSDYVKRIVKMGFPAAVQNAVIAFSSLLIQAGVNSYGTKAAAGFTAYMKVDGFDILPILSFSLAATTFVGQNVGAGNMKRAKKGAVIIIVINMIYTLIMTCVMTLFDSQIISLFSHDPEVIESGVMCIWALAPFYVLLGLIHSFAGAIRGTGNTVGPMVIILFSLCFYRVLWMMFVRPYFSDIRGVYLTYPTSFVIGAVLMIGYAVYLYAWKKDR